MYSAVYPRLRIPINAPNTMTQTPLSQWFNHTLFPLPLSSSNPSFPCSSSSCPRRNRLFSKRTFKAGALNLKLRAGSQAESVIVEGALKAITAACD
jgi:hypothetical protein